MTYHAANDPQPAPGVFVNPGSGPVAGTTPDNAADNMQAFVDEIDADYFNGPHGEDGGRYLFNIAKAGREIEVEMPGLPLAQVRYIGTEEQNIWHFPRLYVEGSSWVWCYATSAANAALTGQEDW